MALRICWQDVLLFAFAKTGPPDRAIPTARTNVATRIRFTLSPPSPIGRRGAQVGSIIEQSRCRAEPPCDCRSERVGAESVNTNLSRHFATTVAICPGSMLLATVSVLAALGGDPTPFLRFTQSLDRLRDPVRIGQGHEREGLGLPQESREERSHELFLARVSCQGRGLVTLLCRSEA